MKILQANEEPLPTFVALHSSTFLALTMVGRYTLLETLLQMVWNSLTFLRYMAVTIMVVFEIKTVFLPSFTLLSADDMT